MTVENQMQNASTTHGNTENANSIGQLATKIRPRDARIAKIEAHLSSPSLKKQFETIPRKDATARVSTALLPENIRRNRFMDILPYEFNRVTLDCGKYVNASHVTIKIGGISNRYIAAQGPLACTVVEFWQTIWTHKVAVIVMVTELIEEGHEKCFEYFPSQLGDRVTFGPFIIRCKRCQHTHSYVTSDFSVTHMPSNLTREIRHIRYTDWQDHSCPNVDAFTEFLDHIDALNRTFNRITGGAIRPVKLLESTVSLPVVPSSKSSKFSSLFSSFGKSKYRLIDRSNDRSFSRSKANRKSASPTSSSTSSSSNSSLPSPATTKTTTTAVTFTDGKNIYREQKVEHNSSYSPPLLVHCSAGVGRSGVVILCDALIRSLDSVNGQINVPEVLTQLRKQRMNSVQNFTQYCFIYKVLIHYMQTSRLI